MRGASGEDLAEPGLDPLEVLVSCGKDAGLDEYAAHVVQGGGLGLLVEQGVGELLAVGCRGQRGQEPAAGLPGEPAVTDRGLPASLKWARRGWSWAGMPRAGSASVACSCWFIAQRAQGRRRGWSQCRCSRRRRTRAGGRRMARRSCCRRAVGQEHLVLAAARAVRGAAADLLAAGAADGPHRSPCHDGPGLAA